MKKIAYKLARYQYLVYFILNGLLLASLILGIGVPRLDQIYLSDISTFTYSSVNGYELSYTATVVA